MLIFSDIPTYAYTTPLIRKPCKMAEKVRSMCFNTRLSELAVISTNGFIHCFNALRFKQTMSKKLPHNKDNVCMAVNDDLQVCNILSTLFSSHIFPKANVTSNKIEHNIEINF